MHESSLMEAIDKIFALLEEIVPLRRDLVSEGINKAFDILQRDYPLQIHEFKTGESCWSWRIPSQWECIEAYVETLDGRRVIDQRDNALHVASYSMAMDEIVSREELFAHLHHHPHLDDEPPYIFYPYQRNWGFGGAKSLRETLNEDKYRVVIRSTFKPGKLKVAEWHIPGESEDCFVLSTNICHPSQANDGPCGVAIALQVMERLAELPTRRYSYRLLVGPETIGAVAWLSRHEALIPTLCGGIFNEMTGLAQPPALQLSYTGETEVDHCCRAVIEGWPSEAVVTPYRGLIGNDERQFNGPGVRVPMLSLSRTIPFGRPQAPFVKYHSAQDSVANVDRVALADSLALLQEMIDMWEVNYFPLNLFKGEAFLSGAGIAVDRNHHLLAHRNMLRIMDRIDGSNSVAEIALELKLPMREVWSFVKKLADAKLADLRTTRIM